MEFTAETKELVDTVAYAARAIPPRPPHPTMAGMRLTVNGDSLTCEGYDYEQSASASMKVDATGEGTILLNGRLLADITKALGADTVTITVEDGAPKAQLVSGRAKYSLPLMPLEDYPALPVGLLDAGTISAGDLAHAIRTVTIAAAKGDTLPILAGTKIEFEPASRTARFIATDRYRLAVKDVSYEPAEGTTPQHLTVLARMLDSSQKAFGPNGQIALQAQAGDKSSLLGLSATDRIGTFRVIDGDYPAVEKIFPTQLNATASLNVAEFREALTRVSLVAERSAPVRITFAQGTATLAAGDGSDSDAYEEIGCVFEGPDSLTFGFNPTYLQDGLNAITEEHVQIGMTEASKPVVLTPVGEDGTADETYRYLLMPVRSASQPAAS